MDEKQQAPQTNIRRTKKRLHNIHCGVKIQYTKQVVPACLYERSSRSSRGMTDRRSFDPNVVFLIIKDKKSNRFLVCVSCFLYVRSFGWLHTKGHGRQEQGRARGSMHTKGHRSIVTRGKKLKARLYQHCTAVLVRTYMDVLYIAKGWYLCIFEKLPFMPVPAVVRSRVGLTHRSCHPLYLSSFCPHAA